MGYNVSGASSYAKKKAHPESQGKCAAYVRTAMMASGGGGLNIKFWPNSACRYEAWLGLWGFKLVYEGNGGSLGEFTPQDGDISVISGKEPTNGGHPHGHIQIYNSTSKKWIADFPANRAWCYGDNRPFRIYRYNGTS